MGDLAIDVCPPVDASADTGESSGGLETRLSCALCCAADDQDAVLDVLPSIVAMGISTFIVPGVDDDVALFEDAVIRNSSGGLVVLCTTTSISPSQARRVASAFTRHRHAFSQFLVLEFDVERPLGIVAPIRRALAGLRRRLGVPTTVNSELRGSNELGSVSGAMLVLEDDSPPRPDRSASVVLEDGLRDEVGPIPEEIMFSAVSRSRPILALVDDETEDLAAITRSDCPTLEIEPLVAPEDAAAEAVAQPPNRAGLRGWPLVMLLGGALTGCLLWAVLPAGIGVEAAPPAAVAVSVASPDLALVRRRAEPPPRDLVEEDSAPRERASSIASSVEARPRGPSGGSSAELAIAVEEGRISALPGFFATRPYEALSDWQGAANRCRSRSVDGVRDWRLPKPAELRALWRSDQIRDTVYWSVARAVRAEVPSNWALDGRNGIPVKREKADRAATICVRSRPARETRRPPPAATIEAGAGQKSD